MSLARIKVPFKLELDDLLRYPDQDEYALCLIAKRDIDCGWIPKNVFDNHPKRTWPYQDLEAFRKISTADLVKNVPISLDGKKMRVKMGVSENTLFSHSDLPNSFIQFERFSYEHSMTLNIDHGSKLVDSGTIQVMTLLGDTYYTLIL